LYNYVTNEFGIGDAKAGALLGVKGFVDIGEKDQDDETTVIGCVPCAVCRVPRMREERALKI